jgi:hypothetical protein
MKRFRSAVTGNWVSRLFAVKNPRTTISETITHTTTGGIVTYPPQVTTTGTTPQCQYCGTYVTWDALECPACHAIFDEGENGVPA